MSCPACASGGAERKYSLVDAFVDVLREDYAHEIVTAARTEICRACPAMVALTGQCSDCGCFVRLKARFRRADCPRGKWTE